MECIDKFMFDVSVQDKAFFDFKLNQLIVISDNSSFYYKVYIIDDLYFLLNNEYKYQGFILYKATTHIINSGNKRNESIFNEALGKMLTLCNSEVYEQMDEKNSNYFMFIQNLEDFCIKNTSLDERLSEIIEFTKMVKLTFYDIDSIR